jgi:sarcosine oxidase subunit gamma
MLAHAQVVLLATGDEPAYRILVPSSFARYLADWLDDAAVEY